MLNSNKRREREHFHEEQIRNSRMGLPNEEDSRYSKADLKDNINVRLAKNFNDLVELLKERKDLLLKKIRRMFDETAERTQLISRGRLQDLRNQAKLLRDEGIYNLIDNSDRINNTKSLLKRIIQQHNFTQFENMEKAKGKKFYDRCREVENDITARSKKVNQMIQDLEKLHDKEKQVYIRLEEREGDMKTIMKRREGDYMRRVEQLQGQLEKYRQVIRENKNSKERKKRQIQNMLGVLMDSLVNHEQFTVTRIADIEDLFGGCEDVHDFESFIKQFQNIIAHKFDEKKDGRKEAALQEMMKIANGYEAYLQQLHRDRHNQTLLFDDIHEGLKVQVKLALVEKVYFQEISHDYNRLSQVMRKCKNYKTLLDNFDGEKARLNKQLNKIAHMKGNFAPRLKALASEQLRKDDLKKELNFMMDRHNQLGKLARKYKDFQYMQSTYSLNKQILERQIDQLADRGNFSEYKVKVADLEALEREYKGKSDSVSVAEFERLEADFHGEVQNLYSRYADIIEDVLVQDEKLSSSDLISKLSKRMNLL